MKIYFAPLEGITGYIYRQAYEEFYGKGKIDKYFTPFISPNKNKSFSTKEINDIDPKNNIGMNVVPQILTNKPEQFIETVKMLEQKGYKEINLNLGCPSGTVVTKCKGAGFLSVKKQLDEFFETVFESGMFVENEKNSGSGIRFSIKTRLGIENPEEAYELFEIYNKYYFEEIIVHPRVQKEYYKNVPHMEIFEKIEKQSRSKVCYNGDIFTRNNFLKFRNIFPKIDTVMSGRGLVADPGFINILTADKPDEYERDMNVEKKVLKQFHDRVLEQYLYVMSGDANALHKMKELWFYMEKMFEDNKKQLKAIKKTRHISEYKDAASVLFSNGTIKEQNTMNFN